MDNRDARPKVLNMQNTLKLALCVIGWSVLVPLGCAKNGKSPAPPLTQPSGGLDLVERGMLRTLVASGFEGYAYDPDYYDDMKLMKSFDIKERDAALLQIARAIARSSEPGAVRFLMVEDLNLTGGNHGIYRGTALLLAGDNLVRESLVAGKSPKSGAPMFAVEREHQLSNALDRIFLVDPAQRDQIEKAAVGMKLAARPAYSPFGVNRVWDAEATTLVTYYDGTRWHTQVWKCATTEYMPLDARQFPINPEVLPPELRWFFFTVNWLSDLLYDNGITNDLESSPLGMDARDYGPPSPERDKSR